MSGWDAYLENLVAYCRDAAGEAHCDKACIIGLNGSKWTSDTHSNALKISQAEASSIASVFSSKNFASFHGSGVVIEGQKYQFLREEEGKVVMAKKKGNGGLTLQCTKTAIVIAHCPEGKQQGNVNKGVATIADYLEGQNI